MTDTKYLESEVVEEEMVEVDEELELHKKIEFLSAGFNAFYNSALEHDKSLLTLSAGGIGLMVTFLTTGGLKSLVLIVFYVSAIVSFTVCLISVLIIFRENNKHIIKMFEGDNSVSPKLLWLDKVAMGTFICGVACATIAGIKTATQQFQLKEQEMAEEKPKVTRGVAMDSFQEMRLLNPLASKSAASSNAKNNQPQKPVIAATPKPAPADKKK